MSTLPDISELLARIEAPGAFATTPTDNSPMGMVNTTVTLKPRAQWRPGMRFERLQAEMDAQLQFPGLPNVWTQPIRNRLDMLLTGIKTPVGIKIVGPDLNVIQNLGEQIERILQAVPDTRSVYAERVARATSPTSGLTATPSRATA
jgi:Cu(I)/Ag(I) efflux system membrane protein CusA/SilA